MSNIGKEIQAKKEVTRLGKFNVVVRLVYLDGYVEVENYKSWTPGVNTLALDTFDGKLKIVNILSLKYFVVSSTIEGEDTIVQ